MPRGQELVQLRTETSQTFSEGDGHYRTEFYSDPAFYRTPGSPDWRPIELDFAAVPGADKAARHDRGPVALQVAPANDSRGFLTLEHKGRRISFRAPAAVAAGAAEPVVDRARAEIPDVLPGVDVRVLAHAYGANSFLVLERPPAVSSFTLPVSAPGLRLAPQSDGSVAFLDAAGKTFATMPQPYAVDSSVDEHTGGGRTTHAVSYTVTTLDGLPAVTTTVDPAWLGSATYPVYVDPSVTIYNEGTITYGDAHVSARAPSTNYANYQRPDSPYYHEMWLGQDPSDATNVNEAFLKFDLSDLAGKTIDSASLEIRPYHQYYNSPTATRTWLRRVTSLWYENEIIWNDRPTNTATGEVYADCVEGTQCSFPITAMTRDWVYGVQTNYGIKLHENANGATHWKRLISSEHGSTVRPRLIVTYHNPTVTAVSPLNAVWTKSRTLDWTFGDSSGHVQSAYDVNVDDSSDFATPVHNPSAVTSATTSHAIPSTVALTSGATYYWRGMAKDGYSWSGLTSGAFKWDGAAPTAIFSTPAAGTAKWWSSTIFVRWTESDTPGSGVASRSLQRQAAPLANGTCGTWANDGTASTGPSPVTQTLAVDRCYRWLLTLTDAVDNSSTTTSGTVIRELDVTHFGRQEHHRFETWDLGADDELAVNVATGNLVVTHPLVTLPIRGSSLSIALTYNSHDPDNVGLGTGWRLNLQRRLVLNSDGSVTFVDGDGARHTFKTPVVSGTTTTYTRPPTIYATLVQDSAEPVEFTLTYKDQSRDTFDISGSAALLTRSEDRHGNGVRVTYAAGTRNIDKMLDTAGGREVLFGWDTSATPNRLTSIQDWAYVDAAGVVQTTATGSRRSYRFFFDAAGQLGGWSNPLNTTGTCPTGGSQLTCLEYEPGGVSKVHKTQTVTTFAAGVLGTATRTITTEVAYSGGDATTVTDAEQQAQTTPKRTTITRESGTRTRVDRPTTTTTYGLLSQNDSYARVQSVWRRLDATQIEERTTWDAAFPTEPQTVTSNFDALLETPARTLSYSYHPSSMGNLAKVIEHLTDTTARWTEHVYNATNDLTQSTISQDGSPDTLLRTVTRYCYSSDCSLAGADTTLLGQIDNYIAGGPQTNDTNVRVDYGYDEYGQRTRHTRRNRAPDGAVLDDRRDEFRYDSYGQQTARMINAADGAVTGGTDVDASLLSAHTDVTTTYEYDTAGNRISEADPRAAIHRIGEAHHDDHYKTRWTFDALNNKLTEAEPATPGTSTALETGRWLYDELARVRTTTDFGGLVAATIYDRTGRPTIEATAPAGSAAYVTSRRTYDADGRVSTAQDERQLNDPTLGQTLYTHDALGRETSVREAAGTANESETLTQFDALDRTVRLVVGVGSPASRETRYRYDVGGRTLTVDDGFSCTATTFDYSDRADTTTSGLAGGTCLDAGGTRTVRHYHDGLGRLVVNEVVSGPAAQVGDRAVDDVYDAAGNKLSSASRAEGVTRRTSYTVNVLDQVIEEHGPESSVAKTNYDAAGNVSDQCYWPSEPQGGAGPCTSGSTAPGGDPLAKVTSTSYDARNRRLAMVDGDTQITMEYDADANYQIKATYVRTHSGFEHQTVRGYDTRHRLTELTFQTCQASPSHECLGDVAVSGHDIYRYDANGNPTLIRDATRPTFTDRYYCYNSRDQLVYRNTGADCAADAHDERFTYDDAGNRTELGRGEDTTAYQYDSTSKLVAVGPTSVEHDSFGRLRSHRGWFFGYDADGRVTTACRADGCAQGYDKLSFAYDGEGRRTQVVTALADGTVSTTELIYAGDVLVEERLIDAAHPAPGVVARRYVADGSGSIAKVVVPAGVSGAGEYIVEWNVHGDASRLLRVNSDGTTTVANSFDYETWGTPVTRLHSGATDLRFRFLYVGRYGVQWDGHTGPSLYFMHERHYAPDLGRFLQPDPAQREPNLYGYARNSPLRNIDPSGTEALSPAELSYCSQFWHWWECSHHISIGLHADRVSKAMYPNSPRNSSQDAFRHCYWAACLTMAIGPTMTLRFGFMHEAVPGNPRAEYWMDVGNNWMGTRVGLLARSAEQARLHCAMLNYRGMLKRLR